MNEADPDVIDPRDDIPTQVLKFLASRISPDDLTTVSNILINPSAMDSPPPTPGTPRPPGSGAASLYPFKGNIAAMDSNYDIRVAEAEVEPFVGKVPPMRTAAAIYKLALDARGIDLTGVRPSAYGDIVRRMSVSGRQMAHDSANAFDRRFPDAPRVKHL